MNNGNFALNEFLNEAPNIDPSSIDGYQLFVKLSVERVRQREGILKSYIAP